jgi:hypothetical protein
LIVASRALKLRRGQSETDVAIRIFLPRSDDGNWSCRYEIDWPEGLHKGVAHGQDSVQALLLALKGIGSKLYTSNYHKAGSLKSADSWEGYGFPVPHNIRDLLIGDDAKYL